MKNTKVLCGIFILIFIIFSPTPTYAQTGWQSLDNGRWTYIKDDYPVTNDWLNYQNERYYLDENGICMENQWFSIKTATKEPKDPVRTSWYYAAKGGKIYRNGWFSVDGHEFYFNGSGAAVRGGILTLENQKYYINADTGKEHSGWFSVDAIGSNGNPYTTWRYANGDGTLLLNGWHNIDGKNYYFDANGANFRKRWFTVDDKKYYANEDGTIQEEGRVSVSGVGSNGNPYTNWYYYSEAQGQLKPEKH